MRWRLSRGARVALVAAAMMGVLVAMIAWRQWPLMTGREIVLETEPVDPRSLFRGDYVDLTYEASILTQAEMPLPDVAPGQTVYVPLAGPTEPGGGWRAAGVMTQRPIGPILYLEGRVATVHRNPPVPAPAGEPEPRLPPSCGAEGCMVMGIDYGIESYFVPEDTGGRLEALAAEGGRLGVIVAVDRRGRAAVAGLTVDGERISREGLFQTLPGLP
ncbi:GDYXXLXY domain-containing protein [Caenispirillum salinarum]|nr:GDYXXLXY domain-containing protein [Caenispirillum salinarum]